MTEPIEPGNDNRLDIVEFLGRVELFKHLEPETRQALASRMRMVYMLEGHIIRDNDPLDGLYIIESGRAKVIKASESGETEAVLALLQPGSSFGEISLIDGLPREDPALRNTRRGDQDDDQERQKTSPHPTGEHASQALLQYHDLPPTPRVRWFV